MTKNRENIMIYWNDYNDHTIIENRSLNTLAEMYDVKLIQNPRIRKETRDWINYARIVSEKHSFNVVYTACFIYYVTSFFADEGISAGAEEEYFLKRLDKYIEDLFFETIGKSFDEKAQKIMFFNNLLDFFKGNEIRGYERKIFQHHIRVSQKIRDWFVSQGNIRETIIALMNGEIEKPRLNMNESSSTYIVFLLTYSEETVWRNISRISDSDRLRILLY